MSELSILPKSIIFVICLKIWLSSICCQNRTSLSDESETIRFASYNVSLFRDSVGHLEAILNEPTDSQIQRVSAVIQKVRPDVLVLMEFDYDPAGNNLNLFQKNYLSKGQLGEKAIHYEFAYQIPSNTGVQSGMDLNRDGKVRLPDDAFGFGRFEGQYASAILSKYPLNMDSIRTFQKFLWKDMPSAKIPLLNSGSPYYPDSVWEIFRLSSKNHLDIPVQISKDFTIHALISHPTPPVFDGDEDRNGKRNHDEIRLWGDYISNTGYLIDDQNKRGGLKRGAHFVIMGDLNSDPLDGDSEKAAINSLLDHPLVNHEATRGTMAPSSQGGSEHNQREGNLGNPGHDTSFFGLRIDYLIPSNTLNVLESGVFWPAINEEGYELIKNGTASDHLLVWLDLSKKSTS